MKTMTYVKSSDGEWMKAKQIALVDENDVPRAIIGLSTAGDPVIAVLDTAGQVIRCTTILALTSVHGGEQPTLEIKPGLLPPHPPQS